MEFPGFLGNEPVKEALSAAFASGRFPHAVILQGEAGTGRHTFARLLAQALVCHRPGEAPCGQCPGCIRAQAGSHPDIHLVANENPADRAKPLRVETIRKLAEQASRAPVEGERNVFILELQEQTTAIVQNKLLKLIEEPPQGVIFLMVCINAQSLLPTIRSRSQIYTLQPPPEEEAARWLAHRQPVTQEQAQALAALCGGNLGRMQAGLAADSGVGQAMQIAIELAGAILAPGGDPMLKAAVPLPGKPALFRQVLAKLELLFRDACLLRCGGTGTLSGAPETARRLSSQPLARLTRLAALMEVYRQRLERNANPQLLVTCFCADLRLG
ncbi:ATP-binding protein [Acutalibacter caecimuris]|uniref:DNA polymerase III subunit n=1 Tax=Acutalibacter caecimuris TaxID=3093657 RepID=UPI002AC9BBC6|nr:DNA polymerase III subunit [Acutalibacter sp. M00118]